MLTVDELKQALPQHLKTAASQTLADMVNNATADPLAAEAIRDNVVSYSMVLKEGKFQIEKYLEAVIYVSFKLMKCTNQEAYKRTFPAKYQQLVANGADEKTISSYVHAYNSGKLVNMIMEQTLIPTWVLNQATYQEAINTQAELMKNSKSDLVRTQAANSLLTHLKRPEKSVVQLDVSAIETSGMKELKDSMAQLAQQQLDLIALGMNTKTVAHQKLVIMDPNAEDAQLAVTPSQP